MVGMMKAAVLHKVKDIRIEEVPQPEIRPDEVLVRIKAVGVCGSDIHFYNEGRVGDFVVDKPLILGHECAGEIVQVGSDVATRHVGQRVAIEPGFPCRRCPFCKEGRYNLCPHIRFLAAPPVDGAYTQYLAVPADFAFPLPDGISFEEGAMMEPLAVGVHSVARGNVGVGDTVAILGVGPIGLVTLQVARARGAARIIASDLMENRLRLAAQMGATDVVNAGREDLMAKVAEFTSGQGVDVVLETAGSIKTVQQTAHLARPGGTVVITGVTSLKEFPYAMLTVGMKELDIKGVFRYANAYPIAIGLVAKGTVDVASLVTHRFPLERTQEALELADTRKDVAIKVMVEI